MARDATPGEALSPEAFYSLYLGGLAIEDESLRSDACAVLLLVGRVGLRPVELSHFHEGWIDWTRGTLHVPGHDPCACRDCWERARERKGLGEDRPVGEIVADLWEPPDGGSRTLSFGWSQRLTGAIATFLDNHEYVEYDTSELEELVAEAASKARGIDEDAVTLSALGASAASFLATAGFGPRRLAELAVLDQETAGEFARVGGGAVREHLYRTLAATDPPDICGEDPRYPLVCDPEPFEREPFDPREYDTNWRVERAASDESRERNPRPADPPAGETLEPAIHLQPSEPAGETAPGVVADSLAAWVRKHEQARAGEEPVPEPTTAPTEQATDSGPSGTTEERAETSGTTEEQAEMSGSDSEERGTAETVTDDQDPAETVTEPVEVSIDTRFVAAEFEGGRPTGGSVVLGQNELLFLSRDQTGTADVLTVSFERIVDLAPGYKPKQLAEFFEDTVGIAYRNDAGEKKIVVCEVPSDARWAFTQRLFSLLLYEFPAVVSDLHQFGDAVHAREMQLSVQEQRLTFEDVETDKRASIRPSRVIDVERGRMSHQAEFETGLHVHHLTTNNLVTRTEIRPESDRIVKLLRRYFETHINRNKRRAKQATLDDDQHEILEALYNAGEGQDLTTILGTGHENLQASLQSLKQQGLVRGDGAGVELTAVGFLVVDSEYGVIRT